MKICKLSTNCTSTHTHTHTHNKMYAYCSCVQYLRIAMFSFYYSELNVLTGQQIFQFYNQSRRAKGLFLYLHWSYFTWSTEHFCLMHFLCSFSGDDDWRLYFIHSFSLDCTSKKWWCYYSFKRGKHFIA